MQSAGSHLDGPVAIAVALVVMWENVMMFKYLHYAVPIVAVFAASAGNAALTIIPQSALVSSTGYYTDTLGANIVTTGGGNASNVGDPSGRNDDGYMALNLGFNFTLFGATYTGLFINNNGNVSFGNGISAFVPSGPTGADQPLISPWFGDVDTRGGLSGVVHYQLDTPGQLIVTWDNVGYYNSHADLLNSYQLVLRSDDYVLPNGEGQIGFFYKGMQWEGTDTSTVAAIGFGDGAGNGQVLDGSSSQAGLNLVAANHHIWFDANLVVVPPIPGVPEPMTWVMMVAGMGMAGAAMRMRRKMATGIA